MESAFNIYEILWRFHAILMSIAFALMAAGFVIVLLRKKLKGWFPIHRGLEIGGASTGLAAFLVALLMVFLSGGSHFRSRHGVAGIIGIVVMTAALVLAILFQRTGGQKEKRYLRTAHRIDGILSLITMVIAVFLGLIMTGIL